MSYHNDKVWRYETGKAPEQKSKSRKQVKWSKYNTRSNKPNIRRGLTHSSYTYDRTSDYESWPSIGIDFTYAPKDPEYILQWNTDANRSTILPTYSPISNELDELIEHVNKKRKRRNEEKEQEANAQMYAGKRKKTYKRRHSKCRNLSKRISKRRPERISKRRPERISKRRPERISKGVVRKYQI